MKSERYEMRMAPSLMEAIDQQRGQLSRAAWITEVLEKALGGAPGSAVVRTSRRNSDGPRPEFTTSEKELAGLKNFADSSQADLERRVKQRAEVEGTPLPKIAPRKQR